MRYLLLCPVAYGVGIISYLGALFVVFGETISRGDLIAVLVGSLIALVLFVPTLYFPFFFALRALLGGWRPFLVFPAVGIGLSIFPTMLLIHFWGGDFRSLLSPEASLFHVLFSVVGAVIGSGMAWRRAE